jgi:hypothetical protein
MEQFANPRHLELTMYCAASELQPSLGVGVKAEKSGKEKALPSSWLFAEAQQDWPKCCPLRQNSLVTLYGASTSVPFTLIRYLEYKVG